jgi:glyoxylase-like metal-dependent hydrolase (beta-lactamase superfamily II)
MASISSSTADGCSNDELVSAGSVTFSEGFTRRPRLRALSNAIWLLAALFGGPAIAQLDVDPIIRGDAIVRLGEHTWAIPDGGVRGVPNVGIVVGDRATLVIDPGLGRRNGEIVLAAARRLNANNELYIASTHYHPEHTTGYVAFPSSAQYVNSTIQEREFAENGPRVIDRFSQFGPVVKELLDDAERRVADITFDRDYSLNLGGVTVRFVVVGPTHTAGDTGLFVVEDAVLFAGDVVMNKSFLGANQGSSTAAWLAAFDTFEAMMPTTIVPAHGEIGDGSLIPIQRGIVRAIQTRAIMLKAEGTSADSAADEIREEMGEIYPGWPRVNGVAALARSAWNEAR